ncbi:MAG: alpha-L-fucosidase [bacterium]|nr:alpha-L-fucosidase [bacterium]
MRLQIRIGILIACVAVLHCGPRSGDGAGPVRPESLKQRNERMAWWRDARFGLFIHWGVYSVPAGEYRGRPVDGIGEWIMNNAHIPCAEYRRYAKRFNPVRYDPDAWVRLAKEAGMKYIIITSKHHDGFALFDSKATEWDVVDATPYGKDLLKPLAEACGRHGLRLGFYHSQAQDWNHPGGSAIGGHWDKAQDGDMDAYIRDIAVPQVREILSNYGPVSVIWWDTPEGMTKERAEAFLPLLDLQPGIIQNNRLGGGYEGDTETPEQYVPATGFPGRDWETCMTMNDTWGYKKSDQNWKSARTLVRQLVEAASKGGNYLLNVGPTSEGLIPEPSVERLKAIGRWTRVNGEAIYGTQASPFRSLEWGRCTQKSVPGGTRLYLHVFDWPADGKLTVSGLRNRPKTAFLLSDPDRSALPVERIEDALVVTLPSAAPDTAASVVVLEIQGKPEVVETPDMASDFTSFTDSLDVTIAPPGRGFDVRYTLDGSAPSISSAKVKGPVRLRETTTVSARCFRGGRPASGVTRRTYEKIAPVPAVTRTGAAPGLAVSLYEGEWSVLPDFRKLRPLRRGTAADFDIAGRRTDDKFGFVFEGFVRVPATGLYAFFTESDDGSRLLIGEKPVVVNDGLHGMEERRGEIALGAGLHPIRVEFFEKTGEEGLVVSWLGPGLPKQRIPGEALFR